MLHQLLHMRLVRTYVPLLHALCLLLLEGSISTTCTPIN